MRTDSNISDREVAMALVTAYERLKENLVEMVKVVYPVYNALLVYGASIGAGPDDDTKRAGNKSGNATIMADKQYRG
ncbi:hypothetical protein FJZ26_03260 [Candidatus Parvarchaeota archaeon]|nr:hypothetical protein [Candidatus Parvarchaeota archaeon]